jgi:hypothetical protein
MSKLLPVPTQIIDEAKIYARKYLEDSKGMHLFGSPYLVWDTEAGSWTLQNHCKILALSGAQSLQWVLDEARGGWSDADIALRDLYAALRHHGQHVPPALQTYVDEILLRGPKGRGRGRFRTQNAFADWVIACLVSDLCRRFDLKPTRGRQKVHHRNSARDIAALVVSETRWTGRRFEYDRVEGIWHKYKHRFMK